MDDESPQPPTSIVKNDGATVSPTRDETVKTTTMMLDDDDEAAIVIESDDLVSVSVENTTSITGSYPVMADAIVHDQLPSVEEMKARSSTDPSIVAANRAKTKKRCLIGFAVLSVVVIVLVAIIVPVKNNKSKASNHHSTTELHGRLNDVIDYLYTTGVTALPALEDLTSPEHRAATFVADGDLYQVELGPKLIERYVLSLMYYYFDGPEWTNNYKFLSARDHCQWNMIETRPFGTVLKGVRCNVDGYVNGLDLSDNSLKGKHLPDEIHWLSNLEALHIQKNQIGGQIPAGIVKLRKLQSLGLMELGLSGTIPSFFGSMTGLTTLAISKNEFYGTIPSTIEKLTDLSLLGLDGNKLSGSISPIKTLRNLEALYLSDNAFTGQIENAMWSKLKELDASHNMLDGNIPSSLIHNPHLMVLDLGHNLFYGPFPDDIKPNDSLMYVSFHGNALTGTLPDRIGYLSSLKHLDIGGMALTGTIPDTIQQLTDLVYLFTENNRFSPQPLHTIDLTGMTKLRDLSMKGNQLTGTLPDWFSEMTSLQLLDLDSNQLSGSIPTWFGLMHDLDALLLNRNKLSGSIPSELANLKDLNVLLLDNNDITGGANAICNAENDGLELNHFVADCYPGEDGQQPEVACRCCTMCCHDSDESCNNKQWTSDFDPSYTYGYTRPRYSFILDEATLSKEGQIASP